MCSRAERISHVSSVASYGSFSVFYLTYDKRNRFCASVLTITEAFDAALRQGHLLASDLSVVPPNCLLSTIFYLILFFVQLISNWHVWIWTINCSHSDAAKTRAGPSVSLESLTPTNLLSKCATSTQSFPPPLWLDLNHLAPDKSTVTTCTPLPRAEALACCLPAAALPPASARRIRDTARSLRACRSTYFHGSPRRTPLAVPLWPGRIRGW